MCSLETFHVDLKGLPEGISTRRFHLTDDFFAALEGAELRRGDLVCTLAADRRGDLFDLQFHTEGTVHVPCDVCLDDMELPVSADEHWVARLGEAYAEDDDLITVPRDEGMLDTTGLIYDQVWLNIPLRHVHAPGLCNKDMLRVLKAHSATADTAAERPVDPRWSALMQLKEKENNILEQ